MDVNKKLRLNSGLVLTLVLAGIPMFAWKFGHTYEYDDFWRNVAFTLAKVGAFGGMAMFALSLILSGRYSWYDKLFGGLDKMYIAHRFLGTFSLVLLFIHPVSLSILRLDDGFSEGISLWFKVSDFGVWLGSIALYLMIAIVLWSIFGRSKYETFVKVHRMLGVVFILGAVHAFMAGSILASNDFMFWYMWVLTAAGAVTFVVYSLFGDILHRPLPYTLKNVIEHGDNIIELELKPGRRIINFAPGQFVYIAFDELEDHGYHPFSISSSKNSSTLKLGIREAGDFTKQLSTLKPGSSAKIKGSYGGFILRRDRSKKQLWIAGGIGVTPFLSGAASLKRSSRMLGGDIEMIYASEDEKPYGLAQLQKIEEVNDLFNVTLFDKSTFGYVSFDGLKTQIDDLHEREIYICGPPPMLEALIEEAEKGGFLHRLHYEEFSY